MDQEELKQAVYKINTASGSGSGFYLKSPGIFVTNYHVVEGNKFVAIEDQQQNRYLAKVVYVNPETDIAFLRCSDHTPLSDIPINDIREVHTRDKIFVLGFPFGMPFTVTAGIVSNEKQLVDGKNFIQTDAAVNPGNSGGPVVDHEGSLVGVTTAKFSEANNVGFAIPANILKEELDSFAQNITFTYSVKCNSCKSLIYDKTDYCPNCGANIDERIFDDKEISKLSQFIEDAIQNMGIDPVLTRCGMEYWQFHSGSAWVRIFVYEKNYLYATSPMNNLPVTSLEALFKYILSNPVPPYQLAVYNNQLYLSYRIRMSDIFSAKSKEIQKNLGDLILKANEMDDFFVNEFACEKTNYSRAIL
ncbi:MAG: trypsin-like serine protease [Bacteroidota bacterium]|nr:trypsin-like serine protease [Bacteroidota bacterium]